MGLAKQSSAEIEAHLVEALKAKYSPSAILLHGSRAVGMARPHSDWDVVMAFETFPGKRDNRETVCGECVEWKAIRTSIEAEEILPTVGTHLQFARVLWERNSVGTRILKAAKEVYGRGPDVPPDQVRREQVYIRHKVDGLTDDAEDPALFFRHRCVLFNSALRLWFEVLHSSYSQPLYLAIPIIMKEDPEFYRALMRLCSAADSKTTIAAARTLETKLFVSAPRLP